MNVDVFIYSVDWYECCEFCVIYHVRSESTQFFIVKEKRLFAIFMKEKSVELSVTSLSAY